MPPADDGSPLAISLPTSTARTRLVLRCQSARHWPARIPGESVLPPAQAQALADLLPVLICGEASAERAFEELPQRLRGRLDPLMCRALADIADDERRHGDWLDALRKRLPTPQSEQPGRRALRFLLGLATDDPALHLSRVAALDAGVCRVLGEVAARGRPLFAVPSLTQGFRMIRRDEGRHVRIARQAALALGMGAASMARERRAVGAAFAELLAGQQRAFEALGVDTDRLQARIASAP